MKSIRLWLVITFLAVGTIAAQNSRFDYYSRTNFSMTSPGALQYGLYGYDNPAFLSAFDGMDNYYTWTDQYGDIGDFNRWGFFSAYENFSFSMTNKNNAGKEVTDFAVSTGIGDKRLGIGLTYGWSSGSTDYFGHSDFYSLGTFFRPNRYLSLAAMGNFYESIRNEGIIEAAVRPLGSPVLSIFGDYNVKSKYFGNESKWSAGIAVEALPGFRITGRYFANEFFNLGANLSLGNAGLSSTAYFNNGNKNAFNVYGIRVGNYDRNIYQEYFAEDDFYKLELTKGVKYQKFRFFDRSHTLKNLLINIEKAKKDKSIKGIVINTSGFSANREILWEVRERLKEFKASGKKVIVYIDRGGINLYHFASVADRIVMDKVGMLTLEGYQLGRNYYKGTLAKLGIGFDEWRFFDYKSAMESFSRSEMSRADSIQRQQLVDDFYKLASEDITAFRQIGKDEFEKLVDEKTFFLPDDALQEGLVDTLSRWDEIEDIVKNYYSESSNFISSDQIDENREQADYFWGEKPKIAVIYALGICAMDEGISARSLVKDVSEAKNDDDIKAIVLRVDSPGGDALASDYIAEGLKKAAEDKPVIVSQGTVAASGGYWLSMYADTIVAAPNTITGSIGVIGGWFYNKDFKEKLGVSTDIVKKGERADLGYGMTIPLLNISLPDRNLTEKERARIEESFKKMYSQFTAKVGQGRGLPQDSVDAIGQGRVWSGYDGKEIGLVDKLGGLFDAIQIAKSKAGIDNSDYEIVEFPEPGMFNLSRFMPSLISEKIEEDKSIQRLKFRMEHNGEPLLLMPWDVDYQD